MSEMLYPAGEVVCCSADAIPQDLLAFSEDTGVAVVMKTVLSAGLLEEAAPFTAAYPIPERGMMLYFCRDGACSVPV